MNHKVLLFNYVDAFKLHQYSNLSANACHLVSILLITWMFYVHTQSPWPDHLPSHQDGIFKI